MRTAQPMPAKRMSMPMNNQMAMSSQMEPADELALPPFEMIDDEIDIMPDMSNDSDELPLAEELIGMEPSEMPVDEEETDIIDMEIPMAEETSSMEPSEMPVEEEEMDIIDMD